MYERMLNKQEEPAFEDLIRHSGENGPLWLELDKYLEDEFNAKRLIRFPYGNEYGWGAKYSVKSRHVCDVFAENGAFTALFQISGRAMETVYDDLDEYARQIWENRHPCKSGGWIEYRVLQGEQLGDLEKIIRAKITSK